MRLCSWTSLTGPAGSQEGDLAEVGTKAVDLRSSAIVSLSGIRVFWFQGIRSS